MVTFSPEWRLERRKLQKKFKFSHLYDGRHFSSRGGSGLEKTVASIP